jgi:molybdopterin converting factor small subunit
VIRFLIPCSLHSHTGGEAAVTVVAQDLQGALEELARRYPECGRRVLDASGRPREWVRILPEGDAMSILPAVAGG